MDPTDITKHIPEVVSVAKVAAASIPFTSIVKRMLGDASDEVAKQLADEIKVYRYGRSLKLLEKAERMAQEAGFTPKAVPIKLLFPLLEGASLEEDENLHDMWASLLANAASPDDAEKVRPGFIAILRELAADEAALLNWMYVERVGLGHGAFQMAAIYRLLEFKNETYPLQFDAPFFHADLVDAFCSLGFGKGPKTVDGMAFETCLWNLDSKNLIQLNLTGDSDYMKASLTFHGAAFTQTCQPPKPKP